MQNKNCLNYELTLDHPCILVEHSKKHRKLAFDRFFATASSCIVIFSPWFLFKQAENEPFLLEIDGPSVLESCVENPEDFVAFHRFCKELQFHL